VPSQRPSTARARLVHAVTEEILNKNEQASFPISSEHQLCRQFNVSRVTVRLALSDLENRGLIYRKHGKGTFAYGRGTRIHRYLGILMKSPQAAEHRPIAEMIRGAQTAMSALRSAILLISTPPEEWRAEKASSLGGVIVVPQDITAADLDILKTRNLPYYIFSESALSGPRIALGQRKAAKHMTEQLLRLGHRRFALLTGFDVALDATKRVGIHEALKEAGLDPAQVCEFSAHGNEAEIFSAARSVLELKPRPTAVIAFDDSLGAVMNYHARRQAGIKVPEELSIVSFHDWPYLHFTEVPLTTVRFDFFSAGQRAAEALSHAALTGQPVADIIFEPTYRAGSSMACVPNL
jgi:DNA-binding LacI/PurR family transcriptional regulator